MLERYGVLHASSSPIIRQKVKESNLTKYGVTCTVHAPVIIEKVKATNLSKYGVEYSFQAEEVKEKSKKTLIERYGVAHSSQMADHAEKVKATCIARYGVAHPLMSLEVKAKSVATCLAHYGVHYPLQSPEIMEKIQRNSKKYKEFKMPSGTVRRVQGYEPFALAELITLYSEEQIKTDRTDIPHITYESNGKSRRYFPDIYIPHENLIIEVKSTWTATCKKDCLEQKEAATVAAGYRYELWCYDGKGRRI